MKKLILFAVVLAFTGCKPERKGTLGPDSDLSKGLIGTWEVSGLSLYDYKWPLGDEMDITDEMASFGNGENLIIRFNEDRSYDVLNAWEVSPLDFGSKGSWMFIGNQEFPNKMQLTSQEGKIYEILPKSMVRDYDPTWSIEIQNTRCGGDLHMGYIMNLTRK